MIYTFNNVEIDEKFQSRLAELLSSQQNFKMYINSGGGYKAITNTIIDMINSNPNKIEIIAYNRICSSAFQLFMESHCKKRILPNTYGMFHLPCAGIEIDSKGRGYYEYDRFIQNVHNKETFETDLCMIKRWGFTEKETRRFIQNKDVYFSYDRIIELITS